jgi:uncharacterized protein YggT (Ycf19 family)
MMLIATLIVAYAIRAYELLIMVWVFGSWLPQLRYQAWYRLVGDAVQPYLNLFRALPLRVQMGAGAMDLTPIVALLVLAGFERLVWMAGVR